MIKYNFDKLKGKIKEKFDTQNKFAEVLGIAPNTLSAKLNNLAEFSSSEISKSIKLLQIENGNEAWEIFFTQLVENNSTK